MSQTGTCRCIPQIKRLRFTNVARALKIRNEAAHEVSDIFRTRSWSKERRRTTQRLVIRQTIKTFEIVRAAAAAVVPTKRFVDVVSRKRSGGPVVPVRTRFRVHKETIEQ